MIVFIVICSRVSVLGLKCGLVLWMLMNVEVYSMMVMSVVMRMSGF